jgi:CRISPR-associated protein Csm5
MWLEIEVLTPVHVGTGELLSPLEYTVNGQQVRIADLGRLFRRNPVRAEVIGQRLAATGPAALRAMTLETLLTGRELADEGLWRYRVTGSDATLAALAGARGKEHELRQACKTPDGRAYLPGTAIKGALRTALIFAWSAATPEWARQFLERELKAGAANGTVQRVLYGARQDPNHDLLRVLAVGDTGGVPPSEILQLAQERVLSAKIRADRTRGGDGDEYKSFLVFLECLKPGETLTASVRILGNLLDARNTQVLGWNARQRALTPQVLCDAANRMSAEICNWELEYFNRVQGKDCSGVIHFYRDLQARLEAAPANVAYLCLGRGAGWHKLTPGILIARHLSLPEYTDFRKKYGLAAIEDERLRRNENLRRFDRRDFLFPKSRKVIAEGDQAVLPLGWVRLVFSDTEPVRRKEVAPLGPQEVVPQSLSGASQVPQGPAVPKQAPERQEAETVIGTLRHQDVKPLLRNVAAQIGRCAPTDQGELRRILREHLRGLGFKTKEVETLFGKHPELQPEANHEGGASGAG